MAWQLHCSTSAPTTQSSLFALKFVDQKIDGDTIKLLKAPAIEDATMWKQQCFQSVYNYLHKKLLIGNSEALISVFLEHFCLPTYTAEESAGMVFY